MTDINEIMAKALADWENTDYDDVSTSTHLVDRQAFASLNARVGVLIKALTDAGYTIEQWIEFDLGDFRTWHDAKDGEPCFVQWVHEYDGGKTQMLHAIARFDEEQKAWLQEETGDVLQNVKRYKTIGG